MLRVLHAATNTKPAVLGVFHKGPLVLSEAATAPWGNSVSLGERGLVQYRSVI